MIAWVKLKKHPLIEAVRRLSETAAIQPLPKSEVIRLGAKETPRLVARSFSALISLV